MPDLRPFRGLRYDPALVPDLSAVLCPPYDVISVAEREKLLARDRANAVRLELPSAFPDWNLTTELRHNLFLAFKEALNNIVKHAKATEVRITLTEAEDYFELVVTDDGSGFSSDEFTKKPLRTDRFATGDGLESMRLRLAEIGGNCEIRSSPGQGTTIRFIVPVKRGAW